MRELQPGELPVSGEDATIKANIKHNLLLRQQRNDGFGYLLDTEAEWCLGRVFVSSYSGKEPGISSDDGDDDEVFEVEVPDNEIGENSRYGAE